MKKKRSIYANDYVTITFVFLHEQDSKKKKKKRYKVQARGGKK